MENRIVGNELKLQVLKAYTGQLYSRKEIKVIGKNRVKKVVVRNSSKRTFFSDKKDSEKVFTGMVKI